MKTRPGSGHTQDTGDPDNSRFRGAGEEAGQRREGGVGTQGPQRLALWREADKRAGSWQRMRRTQREPSEVAEVSACPHGRRRGKG